MTRKKKQSRDSERTKLNILRVAAQEFADRGLHGARIDAIAARTRTTKRMIYYYFGGGAARNSAKAKLYTAVLEKAILESHSTEGSLDLTGLNTDDAIRKVIASIFDHYDQNPNLIRLLITENIYSGKHLAKSKHLKGYQSPIIILLDGILRKGAERGEFRSDVDAVELYLFIISFCFYRAANHFTFDALHHKELISAESKARLKDLLASIVLSHLRDGANLNEPT